MYLLGCSWDAQSALWEMVEAESLKLLSLDHQDAPRIKVLMKLMAVPVKTGTALETGAPQSLFEIEPVYPSFLGRFAYQPTANGQRFLVTAPASDAATPPITLVLNWQAGLKK